ncbi:MAG: sulfatase [Planctomycetota bacterium]
MHVCQSSLQPPRRNILAARRWLLLRWLLALAMVVAAGQGSRTGAARGAEPEGPPRWNILFIFADDWGRYASCYAGLDGRPSLNDLVHTPHIDRLAREGVLFRHAFVNAPSCTPCRSSLLSGRAFFNCGRGAVLHGAVWDESIPTFPLALRDAGYQIGKSFKVWSPGVPVDAPFGKQRYAFEAAGHLSHHYSKSATALVEAGSTAAQARETILQEVRDNFAAFQSAVAPDHPWLYFLGTGTTHRKWVRGSAKELWGIDPDRLAGKLPPFLPDVPVVREDVADYLGEVQAVDAYVGALYEQLEKTGQLERTLIVVSGDHGMPGVPAGKNNLYDHGVQVALVARVPGGVGKRVVDDFVSLPDLAPTFLAIGGAAVPEGLYGQSLLPQLTAPGGGQIDPRRTQVITGRERHVAAARDGHLPYPCRALRTRDFLYIRNFAPDRWPLGNPEGAIGGDAPKHRSLSAETYAAFADMDAGPTKAWVINHAEDPQWSWVYRHAFGKRPAEELYDLSRDPYQIENVAGREEYAASQADMSSRLLAELRQQGDPRLAEVVPFEHSPFTDPRDATSGRPAAAQPAQAGTP